MRYVVAYDVASDARRLRLSRLMEGYGRRIQKSLFDCNLDAEQIAALTKAIAEVLNKKTDRCHVFRLCAECAQMTQRTGKELEPRTTGAFVIS